MNVTSKPTASYPVETSSELWEKRRQGESPTSKGSQTKIKNKIEEGGPLACPLLIQAHR